MVCRRGLLSRLERGGFVACSISGVAFGSAIDTSIGEAFGHLDASGEKAFIALWGVLGVSWQVGSNG